MDVIIFTHSINSHIHNGLSFMTTLPLIYVFCLKILIRKFQALYKVYNSSHGNFGLAYHTRNPKMEMKFADIMQDWLSLQKYLLMISYSKHTGYEATTHHQFLIVLKAAVIPESCQPPIENPLTLWVLVSSRIFVNLKDFL